MRRVKILTILGLGVLLVGCGRVAEEEIEKEEIVEESEELGDLKELADKIIGIHLSKEVGEGFEHLAAELPKYGVLSGRVALGEQVSSDYIMSDLNEWANAYESILYRTAKHIEGYVGEEGEVLYPDMSEHPVVQELSMDLEYIRRVQEEMYPGGELPGVEIDNEYGYMSLEFVDWVYEGAVEKGYIDKRVHFGEDGVDAYAYAHECTEEEGGIYFDVYDKEFTLAPYVSGVTEAELQTSAKYDVELVDWVYYDSGRFEGIYETKEGASERVRIEVGFDYFGKGKREELTEYQILIKNIDIGGE